MIIDLELEWECSLFANSKRWEYPFYSSIDH